MSAKTTRIRRARPTGGRDWPRGGADRPRPGRRSLEAADRRIGSLLAAPAAIVLVAVIGIPLVYAIWMSLQRTTLLGVSHFAGLDAYREVFHSRLFWHSVLVTAEIAIPSLLLELVLGTVIALLLRGLKGATVLRLLIIIPLLLSPAIIGADWRVMLDPQSGIINYFIRSLGFSPISFTSGGSAALPTIIAIDIWQNVGFTILIVTAGLANISPELVDASMVDGTNVFQRVRFLFLPLLRPFFVIIAFWRFVSLIVTYDLVALLTQGGPGNSTETVSMYLYDQLTAGLNNAFAAAGGIILAIIAGGVGLILAPYALKGR
jgi:multiple sugar transport system permease protein